MFRLLLLAAAANALPILQGLDAKLASKYADQSSATIRNVLAGALHASTESAGVSPSFVTCTRDFSACPMGFADLGGSSCAPPPQYTGDCQGPVDFGGLAPIEKSALADACGVSFPCLNSSCDFSRPCPVGWATSGDTCTAPAGYTGPCASPTKFAQFSDAEKDHWSGICGVSFC